MMDVSSLLHKKRGEKEYNLILKNIKLADEEEIEFVKDIIFNFKLQLLNEILTISGTIKTKVALLCSRCIEKYPYAINLNVFEEFTVNPELEDEDISLIKNDKIDIEKIVSDNVILNLPMKPICTKDCKGLCHECGVNLNKALCNCIKDKMDERLIILKKYFDE